MTKTTWDLTTKDEVIRLLEEVIDYIPVDYLPFKLDKKVQKMLNVWTED